MKINYCMKELLDVKKGKERERKINNSIIYD
jgi:hypothetical protein